MTEKIKVLMVDDEAQFRATTRKILNRRGFETILAASGEEAVIKVREKPDVVVLDIKMPGMDGLQTLAEIKKLSADVPVIMLTGHGSEASARQALVQGAFDYLAKPCEIDLLASKIMDAYRNRKAEGRPEEKTVEEVMISIEDYSTLSAEATVKEAIDKLRLSFSSKMATGCIMETGHRSLLVIDDSGQAQGLLAILDLLQAIMPAYMSAPKPSTADSIQYSPMFWAGMFTWETKELAKRRIKEIMSPAPLTIGAQASLMEAAYLMVTNQERRLAVVRAGKVIGVIREQDLFFEMEKTLRG